MPTLQHVDLRTDPAARPFVKDETVHVDFAPQAGELMSLEGPIRYAPGDALISGSAGHRWVVSRERCIGGDVLCIETLAQGQAGAYRNRPSVVLAKQMREAFSMARSEAGDVLHGQAGDWVLQYAPGDYGVVQARRFAKVYRPA